MFTITIPNNDGTKKYTLRKVENVWTCDCPDHLNRSHGKAYVCKHIASIVSSLATFAATAEKSKKAAEILG